MVPGRGGGRNRTGVRGFSGPCLTTPPPRRRWPPVVGASGTQAYRNPPTDPPAAAAPEFTCCSQAGADRRKLFSVAWESQPDDDGCKQEREERTPTCCG